MDMSHLNALEVRASHERVYLSQAKTDGERALREVWLKQIENEIKAEKTLLGIAESSDADTANMSIDDILNELGA